LQWLGDFYGTTFPQNVTPGAVAEDACNHLKVFWNFCTSNYVLLMIILSLFLSIYEPVYNPCMATGLRKGSSRSMLTVLSHIRHQPNLFSALQSPHSYYKNFQVGHAIRFDAFTAQRITSHQCLAATTLLGRTKSSERLLYVWQSAQPKPRKPKRRRKSSLMPVILSYHLCCDQCSKFSMEFPHLCLHIKSSDCSSIMCKDDAHARSLSTSLSLFVASWIWLTPVSFSSKICLISLMDYL